ncbi:MAG: [FeFe] hydrogenase, group A [Treponema sp.]|jgi:ferredoxin hydrogenase|nr:[FeFe] hydrogenase, group A [Treponema sp.]
MSKHQYTDIRIPIEQDNPAIVRNEERCIKCGACRRECEHTVAVGAMYDLSKTGDTAVCIHCGQCANVCPTASITERYEYQAVKDAIAEPDTIVIFSTSPSVRVGLGEAFGCAPGAFVQGKMVAALRALGADYVLDTNFSADLTIMEEAAELVERVTQRKPLPQFTSCCPAWIKFTETFYPALIPNLSSVKSPIGMQGPTIKTWFAKQKGIDPARIVNVALTPCTAKKFEIRREEMNGAAKELGASDMRDMDHVITTRELALWMAEEGVDFNSLKDSNYDVLMGEASGAAIIFGNTGGVMEAAARTAYFMIMGENPPAGYYRLEPVRGQEGIKKASVTIKGIPLTLAVVHGIANAKTLIDDIQRGAVQYDFVEVMTCLGGCIGGGGQPKTAIPMTNDIRNERIKALYDKDQAAGIRCSHDNPGIKRVYDSFYTKPLSPLAKKLLHTEYHSRAADLGN